MRYGCLQCHKASKLTACHGESGRGIAPGLEVCKSTDWDGGEDCTHTHTHTQPPSKPGHHTFQWLCHTHDLQLLNKQANHPQIIRGRRNWQLSHPLIQHLPSISQRKCFPGVKGTRAHSPAPSPTIIDHSTCAIIQ